MNKKRLKLMIQEGEGQYVEFKENLSDISKHLVAFANANGGRLMIGVDDKGNLKKISITNRMKAEILDAARNCDPKIQVKLEHIDSVLLINVVEGDSKPYQCKEGFFLRNGASSEKLKRDDIVNFIIKEGQVRFDEIQNTAFIFPNDFDIKKFKKYLQLSNITLAGFSFKDLLLSLDLAVKGKGKTLLKNAAVILFAKDPQAFFKETYTNCVRYKGLDKSVVIDKQTIYGDLVYQAEEILRFILKNTRLEYVITGKPRREERTEYPMEAIREAVHNALMHRDYFFESSNITVNIFDDRMEISNPGGLVKGLSIEDLGKRSVRRNRLIADSFQRIGFVEKIGSGINRMKHYCREYGNPQPAIKATDHWFDITFFSRISTEANLNVPVNVPINVPINVPVNKRQSTIISLIEQQKKISFKEIRELFKNVSEKTVKRDIAGLKAKKIIKYTGSFKKGYYVIAKPRTRKQIKS